MLKLIALLTMFIDHIGASLLPQYVILRVIGRISFPIFAFSLAEGYIYTRNREKYFKRLLIFSIASLVPFTLLFGGYRDIQGFMYVLILAPLQAIIGHLDIGFTFCLAFLGLMITDRIRANKRNIINYIILVALLVIARVIGVDYGAYGILAVLIFYVFKNNKRAIFLAFSFLPLTLIDGQALSSPEAMVSILLQYFSLLSLPIIFYLKDKEINNKIKLPRWIFYVFYPVHIAILWAIRSAM